MFEYIQHIYFIGSSNKALKTYHLIIIITSAHRTVVLKCKLG